MTPGYQHLATRLLNTPLAIEQGRFAAFAATTCATPRIAAIGSRVGDDIAQAGSRPPYAMVAGIAVIQVQGMLLSRTGAAGPCLMTGADFVTGYDGIRANVSAALADPAVRAIVLDIDSPGGEIAGLLDLADAIYAARRRKPLLAVCNECAFSAAYCLASACEQVTVPRTGGTGGVGVLVVHVDFSKALTDAGIAVTLITSGEHKADGNEYRPLSRDAYRRIKADVDATAKMLIAMVAHNRGLSQAQVRDTEGATYLGAAGVRAGLADAVMSPDEALLSLLRELDRPRALSSHQEARGHQSSRRQQRRSWGELAYRAEVKAALR
ncbi:peptidase S49 family protein [Paraburkholderia xenovorans LB400]|uniref:Protein C, Serine peptidase, MEROPS family S49 n=1 Tax=Paraburkholderia xenovorans (strain LB400) TaxID=266265 RepID=Q144A1_PARXL|nr:S49 family peptidase [Paraburkholderia xenovorans]ABE29338.1 protein C, Serine peptidase, MEROPS family S49 [Paraburkholderia xenovorans LB400]AIP31670.1 peptidase S49 family protein [Paraburkholderia xenovorans LB400]